MRKADRRSSGRGLGKALRRQNEPGATPWRSAAATLALGTGVAFPPGSAWASGTTELVSVGPGGVQSNGESCCVAISADGRFVAFSSTATNLAPGGTGGFRQVFVRDRAAGTTERVSVGAGGVHANNSSGAPTISAGGRFVAFASNATNLVPGGPSGVSQVYLHAR